MNLTEAKLVKQGDELFDIFQNKVSVIDSFTEETDSEISAIIFTVLDTANNNIHNYYHQVLYSSLDNITKPELFFIEWIKNNNSEQVRFSDLSFIQKIYLDGFDQGIKFMETVETKQVDSEEKAKETS